MGVKLLSKLLKTECSDCVRKDTFTTTKWSKNMYRYKYIYL